MSTTAAKMRENSRRKEHKDKSMKVFPSITDNFFSREKIRESELAPRGNSLASALLLSVNSQNHLF